MDEQTIPALIYRLNVKRPVELLRSLFDLFSSDETLISLEGDLSYFDSQGLQVISQNPVEVLSSNAIAQTGTVVLLLNSAARDSFEKNILSRAGIHSRIYHILIAVSHQTVFASYAKFSDGCVWITAEVSQEWLNNLMNSKIIKGFEFAKSSNSEDS